ncbi:uncharacterized protein K02A2.6-like [Malaya genurostris]|uniref:uncharacterized protein K02A2.6-like n=1 Tax=Malaya genurostris TaxID=325434 RepID=UPI0026F39330|nr:uncharacterized protein K02A2.6-like [Malaya genurostris]
MISSELCFVGDVLIRGDRIIVPEQLRQRVILLAHEGHAGIKMMKAHLRSNVWWPKMDQQIERFVETCRGCMLVSAPNPPEPMVRKEFPSRPWEQIAIDFLGPLPDGDYLLVCVDYYSRYLEVVEMRDITTSSTIDQLLIIFSRYGIPNYFQADNGPQFVSDEFRNFCEEQGIHLDSTIPYWPQMNGEVERQNRSILKRLWIAQELGHDWRKELWVYLLTYHSAVHPTTGKAPAELMFGRRLRTKLPSIPSVVDYEEVRDYDQIQKEKGRVYADRRRKACPSNIQVGDHVLAKRTKKDIKLSSDFSPEEYVVLEKSGTDVTIRASSSCKEFRRSAAHLKVIPKEIVEIDGSGNKSKEEDNLKKSDHRTGDVIKDLAPTRSKRTKTEPARLQDFVTY